MPSFLSLLLLPLILLTWATSVTAAPAATATTATSTSTIRFLNHCPYPLYFWTVGPKTTQLPSHDIDHNLVPPYSGSIIHPLINTESLAGGISLKIRDQPYYEVAPAGIIQVEYTLEVSKGQIWYDLSAINCNAAARPQNPDFCPFVDGGVKVHVPGSKGSQCPPAWCEEGKCWNTYLKHGSWLGEPSYKCDAGVEVLVETCTEHVGPRTFGSSEELVRSGGLSPDGTCGLKGAGSGKGYVCAGTRWGECCSEYGFCGSSPPYCATRCQGPFGNCLDTKK